MFETLPLKLLIKTAFYLYQKSFSARNNKESEIFTRNWGKPEMGAEGGGGGGGGGGSGFVMVDWESFKVSLHSKFVLFHWLNGWSRHIWYAILLNDNMDLQISSLGTLVPKGPWCVFYATRRQVYWGLTHMFFTGTLIWYYTHTHTHTHIFTPPFMCSQQLHLKIYFPQGIFFPKIILV